MTREQRHYARVAAGMGMHESAAILRRESIEFYRRTFKPTGLVTVSDRPRHRLLDAELHDQFAAVRRGMTRRAGTNT